MSDALLIRCFLWSGGDVPWSTELTEQFLDDMATWLCEQGFGNGEDLRSILAASNVEVAEDEDEFVAQFMDDGTALIVLPEAAA